jgi:hypothetical protein
MKKDKTKIPKGFYCYTRKNGKTIDCPYYRVIQERSKRLNGWCDFLGKGDLELALERAKHAWEMKTRQKDGTYKTGLIPKVFKALMVKNGDFSLLWDQCKECGINKYTDKELERYTKNSLSLK